MSVLSVPRVYFKGFSAWNPATTNNNDQWPTYDFSNATLNWDYLATQGITRRNFQTLFPPWSQKLQEYKNPSPPPESWMQPPAEWNYYGGNDFSLKNARPQPTHTTVTGGQISLAGPLIVDDPLVGASVGIRGDNYPGTSSPTNARLVDINPGSFWSTQFYLREFAIVDPGSGGAPKSSYLQGPVAPGTRMHLRWMNVQRNRAGYPEIEIAGVAGIFMQTCLPAETLQITPPAGGSSLLTDLQKALGRPGVKGVMARIVVYLTAYFTKAEFDGLSGYTDQYTRLTELWAEALESGKKPIQNPAVSRVVGTVGLWREGELVSMPGGRYLWPSAALTPTNLKNAGAAGLGPAAAEIQSDSSGDYLVLDWGNCIPEVDSHGTKGDFGPLEVKVQIGGQTKTIATLSPRDYDQTGYEARAGIVDLKLPSGLTRHDVERGSIRVFGQGGAALAESSSKLSVQTDRRGVYLDQGRMAIIPLQVLENGWPPTRQVKVLVVQYLPSPPPPAGGGAWTSPSAAQPAFVEFEGGGSTTILTLDTSARGWVELAFKTTANGPGFPILVFFPYFPGDPPPSPPEQIIPVFTAPGAPSIMTAFYSTVRVLPFDNELPRKFAELWTGSHDQNKAWQFVYDNILYLYDMIYPVMKYYAGIDFASQQSVDQSIDAILRLTSEKELENTLYMPVTRELSAGKRCVLQMYGALVKSGFSLRELPIPPVCASS